MGRASLFMVRKGLLPWLFEKSNPGGRTRRPRGKINVDTNFALVQTVLLLFLHKGLVLFSVCQESSFALITEAIAKPVSSQE